MKFSDFGKKFAGEIGIGELMDDLGDALVSDPAPLMRVVVTQLMFLKFRHYFAQG